MTVKGYIKNNLLIFCISMLTQIEMVSYCGFILCLYIYLFAGSCELIGGCSLMTRQDYSYSEEWGAFYKVHYNPKTWEDARLTCQIEGAALAMPYSTNDTTILSQIISSPKCSAGIFIGGKEAQSQMEYKTKEGISLCRMHHERTNYDGDEPISFGSSGDSCLVMLQDGTFDDKACTESLPFVCYNKFDARNKCKTDGGYKFEQRTGSCYKFHNKAETWRDAFTTCSTEGGHLAIINSETESAVLRDMYAEYPENIIGAHNKDYVHIGFHELFKNGNWRNIDGNNLTQSGFASWASGEPNHGKGNEHCGSIYKTGLLNDVGCDSKLPFICEIENNICPVCHQSGYKFEERAGSCYKFHNKAETWRDAFTTCSDEGGHLAIINSDIESAVLRDMYAEYPAENIIGSQDMNYVHIGFHELFQSGNWINIDGNSLKQSGFASWASGEPNNLGGNEHCGSIHKTGLLNHNSCDQIKLAFICEIESNCHIN